MPSMDLLFCDLCNESVPYRDLEEGRAFRRKGRVVCAACDRAMSGLADDAVFGGPAPEGLLRPAAPATPAAVPAVLGAAAAAPRPVAPQGYHPAHPTHAPVATPAGKSGIAIALSVLAILLVAAVAVLLFERIDKAGRAADQDVADLRADLRAGLDALRADIAEINNAKGAEAEEGQRLAAELAALRLREEERIKANAGVAERLAAEIAAVDERVAAAVAALDGQEAQGQRLEELAGTLNEMRADLAVVAEKLAKVQEERAAAAAAPAASAAPGGEGMAAPGPRPAWMDHVDRLASRSAGERWSAVQALADTRDPAVAPHLVPMLKDADIFVRMATARVLGELAAPIGVPALIDALEDQDSTVREAALVSLRSITGQDFKFDPQAPEPERVKKVKAWRDWWEREGAAALGVKG